MTSYRGGLVAHGHADPTLGALRRVLLQINLPPEPCKATVSYKVPPKLLTVEASLNRHPPLPKEVLASLETTYTIILNDS